jgi:Ribbon-helix-helix protein, copG family
MDILTSRLPPITFTSMSHRIQITLTDDQYEFLDGESDRSSVSIAELIRRALDTVYALYSPRNVVQITHTLGRRAGRALDAWPG